MPQGCPCDSARKGLPQSGAQQIVGCSTKMAQNTGHTTEQLGVPRPHLVPQSPHVLQVERRGGKGTGWGVWGGMSTASASRIAISDRSSLQLRVARNGPSLPPKRRIRCR